MKFLILAFFFICSVAISILDIFMFIVVKPLTGLYNQVVIGNRALLTHMPQFVRTAVNRYDIFGLKYNINYLKRLDYIDVLNMPMDEMQNFAHLSVVDHIDCCIGLPNEPPNEILPPPSFEIPKEDYFRTYVDETYKLPANWVIDRMLAQRILQPTDIGNIAYISINHRDEDVKRYAFNLLHKIHAYYEIAKPLV